MKKKKSTKEERKRQRESAVSCIDIAVSLLSTVKTLLVYFDEQDTPIPLTVEQEEPIVKQAEQPQPVIVQKEAPPESYNVLDRFIVEP